MCNINKISPIFPKHFETFNRSVPVVELNKFIRLEISLRPGDINLVECPDESAKFMMQNKAFDLAFPVGKSFRA